MLHFSSIVLDRNHQYHLQSLLCNVSPFYPTISFKNIKRVCRELGENFSDDEIREMIEEGDKDNDGEVGEEEFIRIMKKTALF